jgi:hypothetical protein
VRDGPRSETDSACPRKYHPHSPLHFFEADPPSRFLLLPPITHFLTLLLLLLLSARIRGLCEVVLQLLLSSKCLLAGSGMAYADRGVARGHQRACPADLSPRCHFAACRSQGWGLLSSDFQGTSHMLSLVIAPSLCLLYLGTGGTARRSSIAHLSPPHDTTVTRRQDESRGVIAVLCFLSSSITPTKKGYDAILPLRLTPSHPTYTQMSARPSSFPGAALPCLASHVPSIPPVSVCSCQEDSFSHLLPNPLHQKIPTRNRRCAQEVMDFANSLLDATQRDSMSFRSDACHPSPSAATSAGAAGGGGGWGGYVGEAEEGKCWADAKQMLLIPPSERDKEASERAFPLFLVFCASTCLA